jgi:flavin-dependent dehydrogenase
MNTPPRAADHLVIGGGPAGAMAAIKLAQAGRQVTLVEKESAAHHKVCGEFLSGEAIDYLRSIGIFPDELGAAPIRFVRLCSGAKLAESALPFLALSLSRRELDAALLARAAAAGCKMQRGRAVVSLTADGSGWLAQLDNGESISAHTVFLASGKHDLHGWNRSPGAHGDLVGFKLHWRLTGKETAALRGHIKLFLFSGGYGGLSLVERDVANLCFVVQRSKLRRAGGWAEILAAIGEENRHLRQSLNGAEPLHPRPLAISPIPYGFLNARADGLWRVGDQAAVIPSFSGDGISIALHSASLATEIYLKGGSPDDYVRTLRRQLGGPMRFATCLSRSMVTASARCAAPALFSLVPGAMRLVARATRVPQAALLAMDHSLEPAGSAFKSISSTSRPQPGSD